MSISFNELRLQRFDPDALKYLLDSTEIEHRLLAGGCLDAHSARLSWGDLSISVCDYSFPVLAGAGMPREGGVYVGVLGRAAEDVSLNLRPLPLNQIQLYAPGAEARYLGQAGSE